MSGIYDLDNSPGFLLGRGSLLVKAGLRRHLKEHGYELTPEQWAVLCYVCQNEGKTQSYLADRIFKDKTALTRMLDRLEKSEVLTRRPDTRDRRSYLIFPTELGRSMHRKLSEIVRAYAQKIFVGISQVELQTFNSVLRKITDNVCASGVGLEQVKALED